MAEPVSDGHPSKDHACTHLLHERRTAATVARVETIRLVDEKHLADGLVHDLLGLLGRLAHVAATCTRDQNNRSDQTGERSRFSADVWPFLTLRAFFMQLRARPGYLRQQQRRRDDSEGFNRQQLRP